MRSKPPYVQLRERIFQDFWIRNPASVGTKLPTVDALAERYEVSPNTVIRAISVLAAEGWLSKRQGSGIFVAALENSTRSPSLAAQRRIGLVVPNLSCDLGPRFIGGVEREAHRANCVVEIASSYEDLDAEKHQIELMRRRGVQGVVLGPAPRHVRDQEYLQNDFCNFPIVVVDLYQPNMRRSHVIFDNVSAGREMTRYLWSQGRRVIAFLKFQDDILYRSVDDRLTGYRRALEEAGEIFRPERVFGYDRKFEGQAQHHTVLDRMASMEPRPMALITVDDYCAEVSIQYLKSRGIRVPEDLLVVGFDNLQNQHGGEPFPTTKPDFVQLGASAAELLLLNIGSSETDITEVVLPCPLLLPKSMGSSCDSMAAHFTASPEVFSTASSGDCALKRSEGPGFGSMASSITMGSILSQNSFKAV